MDLMRFESITCTSHIYEDPCNYAVNAGSRPNFMFPLNISNNQLKS